MSLLDKIAAAVMPAATDEQRAEARANFTTLSAGYDWTGAVLEHHKAAEAAFAEARNASNGQDRMAAVRELASLLTGHAMAEEAVIYPVIADRDAKHHAAMAYEEQAMAKIQLAKLEVLDPMSEEWRETLDHVEAAVQQHVYQEESDWYPSLVRSLPESENTRIAQRYREEFERYSSGGRDNRQSHGSAAEMGMPGDAARMPNPLNGL